MKLKQCVQLTNFKKQRRNDKLQLKHNCHNFASLFRSAYLRDNGTRNQTYLYEYDYAGNTTAVKYCTLTASGVTPTPISSVTDNYT